VIILYIDPGAGSLVIQALIAGALAVPFFFRTAIRSALNRLKGEHQPVDNTTPPSADHE
jgi:hypothetical protein